MAFEDSEPEGVFNIVVNVEEQYSIWPADREVPVGWRVVDKSGTRERCLQYIQEVWTDMTPLSVRQRSPHHP